MTCIVGLVSIDGAVTIGGDSAGVAGLDVTNRADAKVFFTKDKRFLIGFTSSFRFGNLLQYSLNPPLRTSDQDVHEYMCMTFIQALRETLKAGGFMSTHNGEETGGTALVGYEGRLFTIGNDFQVGEARYGYHAVGCGSPFALGSLFTSSPKLPAPKRVELALRAAVEFSGGVRPPFVVETLPPPVVVDGSVDSPLQVAKARAFADCREALNSDDPLVKDRARESALDYLLLENERVLKNLV